MIIFWLYWFHPPLARILRRLSLRRYFALRLQFTSFFRSRLPNSQNLFLSVVELCSFVFLRSCIRLPYFFSFPELIVLSGKFDAFHLGLGLVSCAIVAFLSHDLLYHDRSKGLRCRLIEAWAFIRYLPWIIWEVVKANLHVLKLATTRKGYEEMSPAW